MVWNLAASFLNFELLRLVLLATKTLAHQFFEPHVLVDLDEDLVGLVDITKSEGGHACLRNRSVVQDLIVNSLERNNLAHMCLLQEVPAFNQSIVKSMVVCLEQGCSDFHLRSSMEMHLLHELRNLFFGFLEDVDLLE